MIRYSFGCWKMLWLALVSLCASVAGASDWKPVDPALLSKTTPSIEKDADVECVFYDVRVNDSGGLKYTELNYYLRLKIFTERGKEYAKQISLVYSNSVTIKEAKGRTIKPDGSIVELREKDIYDRKLASAGNAHLGAISFAFPAIEPGVIVEYQYKETRPFMIYSRYPFQFDIPVHSFNFHIQPSYDLNSIIFNMPNVQLQKESDKFWGVQLKNVPSIKKEPYMPPIDSIRVFALIFYSGAAKVGKAAFWDNYGKSRYKLFDPLIQPDNDIKTATAKIIGNSAQPDEIIGKLYNFVRSGIKRLSDDASGLTPEQREKFKANKRPSDTLNKGIGTAMDMIKLFGSMATAAGFEVRIAETGDRSDFFFAPSYTDDYFLGNSNVAIKVGNEWKFYDPSQTYLPPGMLPWTQEGNTALIPNPDKSIFVTIPVSVPEKSQEKHKATFKLSEDGTLEGDAVLEYTGHLANWKKEANDAESPEKREEILKEMLKAQMSIAEFAQVQIENTTDPDKPFTYRFHVRIPGYGQRTGKRLFFQPLFFQKGIGPLFTSTQRKHRIYFSYPWSEIDEIEIALPAGFNLESTGGRQPINAGNVGKYQLDIMASEDHRSLRCLRNLVFGSNNSILFPVDKYPLLKQFFESMHEMDNYTLTLVQTSANEYASR